MSHSPHELDSPTVHRQSPPRNQRWAPYKANPADFALSLAEHDGFDAIGRTMTPPPSYSRHPQPRLTLLIPEDIEEDQLPADSAIVVAPDECPLESVDNSPVEGTNARVETSSIITKVKAGLRKRSHGIKGRLRRPSSDSRSSSASTSPSDPVPQHVVIQSSYQALSGVSTPTHDLPAIQELEAEPVGAHSVPATGVAPGCLHSSRTPEDDTRSRGLQHSPSTSSIMPTPKRGLSLRTSTPRSVSSSEVDPTELLGRLESISSRATSVTSPRSPVSPLSVPSFRRQSTLTRSNAVTDNVRSAIPVSPLNPHLGAFEVPPTTPTINGRLDRLPRLAVPQPLPNSSQARDPGAGTVQCSGRSRVDLETDSGKELVLSQPTMQERLQQPFNAPNLQSSHSQAARRQRQEAKGEDAPEVVTVDNSPVDVPSPVEYRQPYPSYMRRAYPQPSSISSLVGTVCEAIANGVVTTTDYLKSRYGPEPPVPEKHVRIRWRCACGEYVYDDFIENRQGAAAELEAYLNGTPLPTSFSPTSSHPSNYASPVFSASNTSTPMTSISAWSPPGSNSPYKQDFQNLSRQTTRVTNGGGYSMNLKSYIEPLWLYACLNEGKWCTKMKHLDVNSTKVTSDKDFALALRKLYRKVHRRWYKLLKLRGLVSIKFVQFEVHRNRFADISRSPALPDPHSPEGFLYEFEQHDLTPPVGSNYLMHLFKHPEDYDDELITYLRTPKRRDRLEIGTGWGLELVEGFIAERVWAALIALLMVGSLVFAVAWMCKGGEDLQGAFAVAGYMVGVAGLGMGWAQAALD